jgi:Sulfotransferase family
MTAPSRGSPPDTGPRIACWICVGTGPSKIGQSDVFDHDSGSCSEAKRTQRPVFRRQEQPEHGGAGLGLLMPRTVYLGAECIGGSLTEDSQEPAHCAPGDCCLRRFLLDERPKLWNVVRARLMGIGSKLKVLEYILLRIVAQKVTVLAAALRVIDPPLIASRSENEILTRRVPCRVSCGWVFRVECTRRWPQMRKPSNGAESGVASVGDNSSSGYTPVVIIGAARSGTNMLRDVLTSLDGFDTWPCDEIPFVWRAGAPRCDHDEFTAEWANARAIRTIRCYFDRMAQPNTQFLVEKTCANSLRVDYVARCLPDARYLFICRNGWDAAASAAKRWTAGFDIRYSLAKSRYIPPSDMPYYALQLLQNRVRSLRDRDGRLATWGPRFRGMAELAGQVSVVELAARQWAACVEASDRSFAKIPQDRWMQLRYEDFVNDAATELMRILEFLQVEASEAAIHQAISIVRATSVGKGIGSFDSSTLNVLRPAIAPLLHAHGYAAETSAPCS